MQATDKTNNVGDTADKLRSGTYEAVDKIANASTQAAEALGEKGEQLKYAEQQLMRYFRSYLRYNPWVSQ